MFYRYSRQSQGKICKCNGATEFNSNSHRSQKSEILFLAKQLMSNASIDHYPLKQSGAIKRCKLNDKLGVISLRINQN